MTPVVDFHCDTLSAMREARRKGEPREFLHNDLHIDLEKLKKGGYLLQCFAIFVNLGDQETSPLVSALEQFDIFAEIMESYPQEIGQVKCRRDLEENRAAGRVSALLTVEDAGCCLGNLALLRTMYRLGVRIMTLTWNHENELGFPNRPPKGAGDGARGLKEAGFAFLKEMECLGILVDVSHLSDEGFWDVYRHTERPFIASHSNARAVCAHPRNLTDDMLRAVAERGGVTGINYYGSFLDPRTDSGEHRSTVALMADHIDHIRQVGGIDMIALGSDFDGIGGELEMKDCSYLPLLEAELHRRHYSGDAIEKIFCGNALRVLREVL